MPWPRRVSSHCIPSTCSSTSAGGPAGPLTSVAGLASATAVTDPVTSVAFRGTFAASASGASTRALN